MSPQCPTATPRPLSSFRSEGDGFLLLWCSHVICCSILAIVFSYLYNVGMYVATVPNRNSPPAILLRESFRLGGKVRNRTLSNLSHLPPAPASLRYRPLPPARPRGRGPRHLAPLASRPAHRHAGQPRTRFSRGPDRGPRSRTSLQAGHFARPAPRYSQQHFG